MLFGNYCLLVSEFKIGLKNSFASGLSEPEIYDDLVYKLKKDVSRIDFSDQKDYHTLQVYWI